LPFYLISLNCCIIISNNFSHYQPPLDGIREEIITDISLAIGGDYNIFTLFPNIVKPKNPKSCYPTKIWTKPKH
jgi:hypothetical protein